MHVFRYYHESNGSQWLRLPATPHPSARRAGGAADDLVDRDIFHLSGVGQVSKIPRNSDGGLDWLYKGAAIVNFDPPPSPYT